ncbi:hypothetical protein J2S13_001214 [Oikeobacillus pervagus]|uniref:Uncharacterized protein n=1 Tax=Oikeobacillus pervagus TaxID=1325931 RepID=A0AAJ1WGA1_9BACI|nr:hypothetical protein [Oikeobacillus pervagus]
MKLLIVLFVIHLFFMLILCAELLNTKKEIIEIKKMMADRCPKTKDSHKL